MHNTWIIDNLNFDPCVRCPFATLGTHNVLQSMKRDKPRIKLIGRKTFTYMLLFSSVCQLLCVRVQVSDIYKAQQTKSNEAMTQMLSERQTCHKKVRVMEVPCIINQRAFISNNIFCKDKDVTLAPPTPSRTC